jgi:hypothetical protein
MGSTAATAKKKKKKQTNRTVDENIGGVLMSAGDLSLRPAAERNRVTSASC